MTAANVRIAEFVGYKRLRWEDRKGKKCSAWRSPDGKDLCPPPPDYCSNLNAIAEAISYLRNASRLLYIDYHNELGRIVAEFNGRPEQEAYHPIFIEDATAAQRAAALGRVINQERE